MNKWEAPWFARALRAGGGKGERRCGSTDACAAVAAWGKERRILAAGPLPLLMRKHTGGGVSIALGFIGNVELRGRHLPVCALLLLQKIIMVAFTQNRAAVCVQCQCRVAGNSYPRNIVLSISLSHWIAKRPVLEKPL